MRRSSVLVFGLVLAMLTGAIWFLFGRESRVAHDEIVRQFLTFTERGSWEEAARLTTAPLRDYVEAMAAPLKEDRKDASVSYSGVEVYQVPNRKDLWRAKYLVQRKGSGGTRSLNVLMEFQFIGDKIALVRNIKNPK